MIEFRKIRKTGGSTYIITLPKKWIKLHNIKANQNLECITQEDGNLLLNPLQSVEFRKIQSTGGSSSIVSLPKDWVISNHLRTSQEIAILPQENGMLLLNPHIHIEKERLVKKIDINAKMTPNFLLRLIIGSYVMGYSLIKISANREFPSKFRDVIINFIKMTVGIEIAEENFSEIILQETISINDMTFEKGIKRMEILVKSMHKDISLALETHDQHLLTSVILRDEEINKFHRLVRHQMNRIINNTFLAQYSKVSIERLKQNFLLSQNIERIGDHTVNIARHISSHFALIDGSNHIPKIKEMSTLVLSSLSQCMNAWKTGKIILANEIVEKSQVFDELYHSFLDPIEAKTIHFSLFLIKEEFKKISLLIANIAEIIIDSLIREM